MAALGVNVNEAWFALAMAFYSSGEYLAFNRDDRPDTRPAQALHGLGDLISDVRFTNVRKEA